MQKNKLFSLLAIAFVALYFVYCAIEYVKQNDANYNKNSDMINILCSSNEKKCFEIARKIAKQEKDIHITFSEEEVGSREYYQIGENGQIYCIGSEEFCKKEIM
ncbi:hypothetical protein [Candidatus Deianiraea vastatrix]|uniref:Uncharacterized protein n=1 Tax=Candidatus Deianiraea vastatrix TaxID=2163644 RepID=A0A5B8XDC5_9RICK|nr:hypothetical protein [Candidatus Deianiraea vastatrix]QED23273.1 hypothetical protein Deia_00473 [Candidatus Deianiraea vastatrix]